MTVKVGDIVIIKRSSLGQTNLVKARVTHGPTKIGNETYWYVVRSDNNSKITIKESDIEKIIDDPNRNGPVATLGEILGQSLKESEASKRKITLGSKIKLRYLETNSVKTYTLVENSQHSPESGMLGLHRPLGLALIDHSASEVITVNGQEILIESVEGGIEIIPKRPQNIVPKATVKIKNIKSLDLGEKKEIVLAPPQQNSLILAGPGTGKSYCLVNKVANLIEEFRFSPNDILILSFSREAVAEVRRRLANYDVHNIQYIRPVTVDKLSATIIRRHDRSYQFGSSSYDNAVCKATELLKKADLESYKHIFIDEVQDIVGCRAEFIYKVLCSKPATCGVTLLGDSDQAIYNWSLENRKEAISADQFLENAKVALGQKLVVATLNKTFRTSDSVLNTQKEKIKGLISRAVEQNENDLEAIKAEWAKFIDELPKIKVKGPEKYIRSECSIIDSAHQKCILFRDNGQLIGEMERNLPDKSSARVLGKYTRGLLPKWVALFMDRNSNRRWVFREPDFIPFFEDTEIGEGWAKEEAWELLKLIEENDSRQDAVDMEVFKKRLISLPEIPMSVSEKERILNAKMILSTYHCSKGLEFDKVILAKPALSRIETCIDLLDELRLFYVGFTRAKISVQILEADTIYKLYQLKMDSGQSNRWWRQNSNKIEFNVDGDDDIDSVSFVVNFGKGLPHEIQHFLAHYIKVGDAVDLRLERLSYENKFGQNLRYFIYIESRCVGCMSYSFFRSMAELFKQRGLPSKISARVNRVYSEYRFDVHSCDHFDERYTSQVESWLALKLGGLCVA